MDTDTTPEISQEAARAMLAALQNFVACRVYRRGEPVGWRMVGATVSPNLLVVEAQARAAIALAEGRAS